MSSSKRTLVPQKARDEAAVSDEPRDRKSLLEAIQKKRLEQEREKKRAASSSFCCCGDESDVASSPPLPPAEQPPAERDDARNGGGEVDELGIEDDVVGSDLSQQQIRERESKAKKRAAAAASNGPASSEPSPAAPLATPAQGLTRAGSLRGKPPVVAAEAGAEQQPAGLTRAGSLRRSDAGRPPTSGRTSRRTSDAEDPVEPGAAALVRAPSLSGTSRVAVEQQHSRSNPLAGPPVGSDDTSQPEAARFTKRPSSGDFRSLRRANSIKSSTDDTSSASASSSGSDALAMSGSLSPTRRPLPAPPASLPPRSGRPSTVAAAPTAPVDVDSNPSSPTQGRRSSFRGSLVQDDGKPLSSRKLVLSDAASGEAGKPPPPPVEAPAAGSFVFSSASFRKKPASSAAASASSLPPLDLESNGSRPLTRGASGTFKIASVT